MPMKWDEKARTTLLLKLIEQNPSIVSSVNADTLAKKWPGPNKPTGRAIIEQIKVLKKEAGVPSTPSSKRVTNNVPRTPRTPSIITAPSTKRSNNSAHTGSATKKRKISNKRKASDDESEEDPVLSSSADDDTVNNNDDGEQSAEESSSPSSFRVKRDLPVRGKSRSRSYVADVDSAGEDEAAKQSCSDDDETFSLEMLEQDKVGRGKSKLKMGRLDSTGKDSGDQAEDVVGGADANVGVEDSQGYEVDSDDGSEATGRSHQTFYSAPDYEV